MAFDEPMKFVGMVPAWEQRHTKFVFRVRSLNPQGVPTAERIAVNVVFRFVKESHLVKAVSLQSSNNRQGHVHCFVDLVCDSSLLTRLVNAVAFSLRLQKLSVFVSNSAMRISTIPSTPNSDAAESTGTSRFLLFCLYPFECDSVLQRRIRRPPRYLPRSRI